MGSSKAGDEAVRDGKLSEFTPDQRNANKGTEYGGHLLEKSLTTLGGGRSILADKHGNLIAGNKTAEKAASIGMDDVIIVRTDGKKLVVVQRTDIDINTRAGRELALLDNKVSQVNLDFDVDVVIGLATDFTIDVGDLGFRDIDQKKSKKSDQDDSGEGGGSGSGSQIKKPDDADTHVTFALTLPQSERLFKALETAKVENDVSNGQGTANELCLLILVNEFLARRS